MVRHPPALRALSTSLLNALAAAPVGGMYVGSVNGSVLSFAAITLSDTPRLRRNLPFARPVYTAAPFGAARLQAFTPNFCMMNCSAASMSAAVPLLEWLWV